MEILSHSSTETFALGQNLAQRLRGGEAILLIGNLGSGKTVFTKGLAAGLGIDAEITSPTYVFLRSYQGPQLVLYHFDFYRLTGALEVARVGLSDHLSDVLGVFVVEWPKFFPKDGFKRVYRVELLVDLESVRRIRIEEVRT